jgi:hypothetical protein
VVKKVGLDVKVVRKGRIKDVDLYENAPFTGSIVMLNNPRYFRSKGYQIIPSGKNGFQLK